MPEMNGLSDPLDSGDYDPIEHLNAIFSHPSTLSSVAPACAGLRSYHDGLNEEIAGRIVAQSAADAESVAKIEEAKNELSELFARIENVRAKALQTELTITNMTADIKRLDGTKKNLTLSMTALKRLQMLTTAYEQLRVLSKSRQYRECAQLLQAVMQLMAHFKSYRSIDQIATLSRNVSDLERELLEQVCEDFEITFAKGEVAQRRAMLSEACLVIDALGDSARSRLITWYCNTQLREYRQVFRGSDEAGSLDNIARRFAWFKRMLKTYDEEHGSLFPPSWKVNELLANSFCEGTRDDFKGILSRSIRRGDGQGLDVNLLLSCLQETMTFEQSLERRFATEPRDSLDTLSSREDRAPIFGRAISEAFEPYLSLWVESQDKQLSTMIPKYRQQPLKPADEEFSTQLVISSSTELFNFYKLTLAQCAKLSTGSRLVELSKIFAKYLDEYAQQVLLHFLNYKSPQDQSIEDIIMILNTADYCHTTTLQLEERIKHKVDEELRSQIDLQSQGDAFMGIASAAVRALVRKVEVECDTCWREMRNIAWSKLESVGDQSSYVGELMKHIQGKSKEILHLLHKQQYARAFCDNLVELMALAFVSNIVQCRPISEVGAEQMLLDSYMLRKGFEELLAPESGGSAPALYVKRVNQSMQKVDLLLKTLQVPARPPEGLIQAYLIQIGDSSDTNFRKILDLKGIRKQDQPHLVEIFQAHRASHDNLVLNSPFLSSLQIQSSHIGTGISVSTGSTASLPNRFDASTLGSAIMSAARDGVDRFGAPPTTASSPGGAFSPTHESNTSTHLNENLRNIGKFFRRDIGSFGGSFGGNKSSEDSTR